MHAAKALFFKKRLMKVMRHVLQCNAIGKQIGLTFESHLLVGPLPMEVSNMTDPTSQVLGLIPPADTQFRVRVWFLSTTQARPSTGSSTAGLTSQSTQSLDRLTATPSFYPQQHVSLACARLRTLLATPSCVTVSPCASPLGPTRTMKPPRQARKTLCWTTTVT